MHDKKTLGIWGELVAQQYYERHRFRVVEKNFRCRSGEIDLICCKHQKLYFIEVKTRSSTIFGYPEEAVTPQKFERMRQCATDFLATRQVKRVKGVYFQVCAIHRERNKVSVRIFTDIL